MATGPAKPATDRKPIWCWLDRKIVPCRNANCRKPIIQSGVDDFPGEAECLECTGTTLKEYVRNACQGRWGRMFGYAMRPDDQRIGMYVAIDDNNRIVELDD